MALSASANESDLRSLPSEDVVWMNTTATSAAAAATHRHTQAHTGTHRQEKRNTAVNTILSPHTAVAAHRSLSVVGVEKVIAKGRREEGRRRPKKGKPSW